MWMNRGNNREKMESLVQNCTTYLHKLCVEIQDRSVGTEGNRKAASYFETTITSFGWAAERQEFEAVDWEEDGARLQVGDRSFEVLVSPYSLGCDVQGELVSVADLHELEGKEIHEKILLLHGEIAREQIMPKNFVFYNPEEHQRIISLLEKGSPAAIVCATGRNSSTAGGVYPFPLIEDGDFDIPSVFMTEEEGSRLLPLAGKTALLQSRSTRIHGTGFNVVASKGMQSAGRILITAHIDAKRGTPGAIDNATGVVVLMLLADLLKDYDGNKGIEIVALNGEDYYAVPGQMLFLERMQGRFKEILLNINIDGAGFKEGLSAFSFYGLPEGIQKKAEAVIGKFDGITEGDQWVQGDHSIFIQNGVPAVAVSSSWLIENMDNQEITHTPKDNFEIVDCRKLVEIARALELLIRSIH